MMRAFLVASLMVLSGCSVTAGSTDGTSESFQNSTDSSGDFSKGSTGSTSSTSPRGSDDSKPAEKSSPEKELTPEQEAFISRNDGLILADISAGQGEYLTAVAELLKVPSSDRSNFYAKCTNNYSSLSEKNLADSLLKLSTL